MDQGHTLKINRQTVVRQEVGADDGLRDVGDEEDPLESLAGLAFQREGPRTLAVSVDGRCVGSFQSAGGGETFILVGGRKEADLGPCVDEEM